MLISIPIPPTHTQTKEEISSQDLVPNLNMKRLIYDLVNEGGQGLAAKPTSAEEASQETAFGFDDVMVLRCLGPAESDWMNRSQVVTKDGVSGGRRRNSTGGKDSMVFQDTTVSRRHFEAGWAMVDEAGREGFYIQDLGSAGGTYLRLRPREAMGLRDGAMLLVGKHQFLVLAPSRVQELQVPPPALAASVSGLSLSSVSPEPPSQAAGEVAAAGLAQPDESNGGVSCAGGDKTVGALIQAYLRRPRAPLVSAEDSSKPQMLLKCFAPEGSPMQHRVFAIGTEGATVGRKTSNTVTLSQEKGGEVLGLDSAVSGEHCRIEFQHPPGAEGGFVLLDGGAGGDKPSTNGTWARLSYMQMASPRQVLERDDEILVGGILRFAVGFDRFLMEGVVPHGKEEEEEEAAEGEGGGHMSDGESSTPRSKHEGNKGLPPQPQDGREQPMDIA